jgi:NAD-dependent dihydropyrimidine dehydrogenase PreA subunit
MIKRKIINIDAQKCNGCGLCIPNCPEGAIQLIDGKAVVVNDMFCDGLGVCIGHCPEGAITIEEREAEKYSESKVMENIVKNGNNTIIAHLEHLREHNEEECLREALDFLDRKSIKVEFKRQPPAGRFEHTGCPGARMMTFGEPDRPDSKDAPGRELADDPEASFAADMPSELRQWPIQLHLVPPTAPYFRDMDVVLAADCTAYCLGGFHQKYLKGKSIAIACPKLDQGLDIYADKLKMMIDQGGIRSLTVLIMEVPCCSGLFGIARRAAGEAERNIPIQKVVVGIRGEILER